MNNSQNGMGEAVQYAKSGNAIKRIKKRRIGLSRRELNPGLERIELMFKLDKLTY
ncbi:uncharacterized protein B0T23DRAFT_244852 [Neurospora hispaniola]|uniref:Uncharacterized protein n=1 Tax=Neurospora hispaniola TaxID=588809 RepID=A0AAJ0HZR4_9PEZI|nr:hypothetical protein B0T23DRAFT_244852 [Neurospora hispaniola]